MEQVTKLMTIHVVFHVQQTHTELMRHNPLAWNAQLVPLHLPPAQHTVNVNLERCGKWDVVRHVKMVPLHLPPAQHTVNVNLERCGKWDVVRHVETGLSVERDH